MLTRANRGFPVYWAGKGRGIVPALLFLAFLLSCRSAPSPAEDAPGEGPDAVEELSDASLLPSWIIDSSPVNGRPVFVVFTGNLYSDDDEMEAALMAAAGEAVRYLGAYVNAKELSQEGNTTLGYASDIRIDYPEERAADYKDMLELDRVARYKSATIARFLFTGKSSSLQIFSGGKPPSWIVSPPAVEGYVFAVGAAKSHSTWEKSFEASDEKAIAQLAYALFGKVGNQKNLLDRESSSTGSTYSLETVYMRGEGILRELLIAGRWVDEGETLFYSLAAAPLQ